jgi:hypothetical protein
MPVLFKRQHDLERYRPLVEQPIELLQALADELLDALSNANVPAGKFEMYDW